MNPTIPADLREVVARAISTKTYAVGYGNDDCGEWHEMPPRIQNIYREAADAALAAIVPAVRAEALREAAGKCLEVSAWIGAGHGSSIDSALRAANEAILAFIPTPDSGGSRSDEAASEGEGGRG